MLVHNRVKELQSISPDVFSEIKSIPRWTFVRGSLSYVIHCISVVLEKRYVLGMTDQLKPYVIKLLFALHWILMNGYKECSKHNESGIDLPTIELFIQMCIPFLSNLNESDLSHSLQPGIQLWQPLWNHMPPRETILAQPVSKCKSRLSGLSPCEDLLSRYSVATYFDIALIRVMMVDNWTLYGYRWGLQYLQNHLLNVLFRQGFDCENCAAIRAINKFSSRKSVLLSLESQGVTKPADVKIETELDNFPKINDTVPEEFQGYLNNDGTLRINFILDLIKKLVKNINLHQLSGSLLFVHSQVVEIALDDQNLLKTLITHFPSLLFCQIKIMQLFGCERNCGIGIRGKADNYRYLAHGYLYRLLHADKERAKSWLQRFVTNESIEDIVNLLHSLFAFCNHHDKHISKSTLQLLTDDGDQNQQQQQEYLERRSSNEKNIINWTTPILYKKITTHWRKENPFESVVRYF